MAHKSFKSWMQSNEDRRAEIERLVEVAKKVNPEIGTDSGFMGLGWLYDLAFQMSQRTEVDRLRKEFNMSPDDAMKDICSKMTVYDSARKKEAIN